MSIRPIKVAAIATTAMALIVSGSAQADWLRDYYWGVGAGWHHPTGDLAFTTSDAKDGWMGDFKIGGHLSHVLRAEIELSRREAKINGAPLSAGTNIHGNYTATSIMANVIWDWNPSGGINPYIGAGAGATYATAKGGGHVPPVWNINDQGWGLGGQAFAGLDFHLSSRTAFDVEYRWMSTDGVDIQTPLGKKSENFSATAVLANFRFLMGSAPVAAPPPPPPPPPMAPATSMLGPFKVYFQWDKSNLTKEAKATVDEVAAQVKNKKIQKVHIEGDTDTSGSDAYNQALSDRRSAAVRDALIADGVPADAIDTVGLGESNPAVKTGDAVKEPLNRRAEITITILNN